MNYLGIDIGTTSVCMLCSDENGNIIKSVTVPNDSFIKTDRPYEKIQDPGKIISTVFSLLDGFLPLGIGAIGVDGQMHGILYTGENGEAVSDLAIWQDGRGDLPYPSGEGTYASVLSGLTGYPMATGYGLTTHFYNVKNGLVPAGAKKACTIHDYAVMKLCGLKEPLMHSSDAASFGAFSVSGCRFDTEKLAAAGISADILPAVTDGYEIAGNYKGIPVCVAIGDNQASFTGAGGNEKSVLLNYGTGSQINMIAGAASCGGNAEIRPLGNGKNICVGCSLCGGRAYAVLEEFFRDAVAKLTGNDCGNLYAAMDRLFEESDGSLTVGTLFSGTRKDPSLRGSVGNIGTDNFTAANLIGGTLAGMCDELYGYYLEMLGGREKPEYVIGSGNGIRKNRPLCSIIEKRFGLPLRVPAHREEAAFGAMLTGAVAAGGFCDIASAIENTVHYI